MPLYIRHRVRVVCTCAVLLLYTEKNSVARHDILDPMHSDCVKCMQSARAFLLCVRAFIASPLFAIDQITARRYTCNEKLGFSNLDRVKIASKSLLFTLSYFRRVR